MIIINNWIINSFVIRTYRSGVRKPPWRYFSFCMKKIIHCVRAKGNTVTAYKTTSDKSFVSMSTCSLHWTLAKGCEVFLSTVYPKKYAHGFVVLCFVVVTQSFIMNSHEVFIHIHQGCFAGTGAIVRLPQCQRSKLDGYGKISQCITTTMHSKAKTVCIFLGIYCIEPIVHIDTAQHIPAPIGENLLYTLYTYFVGNSIHEIKFYDRTVLRAFEFRKLFTTEFDVKVRGQKSLWR